MSRKQLRKAQQHAKFEEMISDRLAAAVKSDVIGDDESSSLAIEQEFDDKFERALGSESMSDDVFVDKFDIHYSTKPIFTQASLHLHHGKRYAMVGPNGVGKSTLLRHIEARKGAFAAIPSHFNVLHVAQEAEAIPGQSVLEAIMSSDRLLVALLKAEKDGNGDIEVIQQRLESIDGHSAESRATTILLGLQFLETDLSRCVAEFSGGWRMRISLAQALFCRPTLLLLDEPTNHLDYHAVEWLCEYLSSWKNILLMVSHDRHFMNEVCTDVLLCDNQKLVLFKDCRWDEYWRKRVASLGVVKRGERAPKPYIVNFWFGEPTVSIKTRLLISVKEMSFAYEGQKPLFRNKEFGIDWRSRIALIGQNGSGKTTLLKLLKGELAPTSGSVECDQKLIIGEFSQHFVDQLLPEDTPITHLQKKRPSLTRDAAWKMLAKFGLTGKTPIQLISTLSGGQKSRVVFTNIALSAPHILILDEPTNHLDVESIEALRDALKEYPGAVVLVSHDKRLVMESCSEIMAL